MSYIGYFVHSMSLAVTPSIEEETGVTEATGTTELWAGM